MDIRFLVIEGNIGAGKTTLATRMSGELNAKLVLEQFADNPFLPKFYADQERYSFPLELSFLADRYNRSKRGAPAGTLPVNAHLRLLYKIGYLCAEHPPGR